jgi:hypothetical protein
MADENKCSPLEATLIHGINYVFQVKSERNYPDFIFCKAAVILPVQQCTSHLGNPIESKLAFRLYSGPEDLTFQKLLMPGESFSFETISDGLFDLKFGPDIYRLCNFGGQWVRVEKKDFSDLAGTRYSIRKEHIELYVSQWLKEVFKDGA